MVGLDIPVIPVEHQYILTGDIPKSSPAKRPGSPKWAFCAAPTARGICAKSAAVCCSAPTKKARPLATSTARPKAPNTNFSPTTSSAWRPTSRTPSARSVLRKRRLQRGYNGAICYTPDGSPIVAPLGACAIFGSTKATVSASPPPAGPAGRSRNGSSKASRPSICWASIAPLRRLRVARLPHRKKRGGLRECLHDSLPRRRAPGRAPFARRALLRSAARARRGFGQKFGWERANFFAAPGGEQKDDWSFRRSNWFECVRRECENVARNVGVWT